MANSSSLHLLLIISVIVISSSSAAVGASGKQHQQWRRWVADGESEMDSEINRRLLQYSTSTNYISYGVLQSDSVPCSQRGQSYYNCQTGAEANPYTRGCSAITQCRSDS